MMKTIVMTLRLIVGFIVGLACMLSAAHGAAPALSTKPLYLDNYAPPLILLTMQRDHRLFMEAYDDVSDLDGDGTLDTRYTPAKFDYYGYFDSFKCYKYDTTNNLFYPDSVTANKKCGSSSAWSGDYLNYLTTSRMDALRKVLYGGKRSTDTSAQADTSAAPNTVLERAYISRDFHCWGKSFDPAVDTFDITEYSTLSAPTSGKRHLFSNTTNDQVGNNTSQPPLLRVLTSREEFPWSWVAKEIVVCDKELQKNDGSIIYGLTPTDFRVRVQVCKEGMLEDNCVAYGATSTFKPTGLLHQYGANDSMKFGLLSGSFDKPTQGGVLRKNVTTFRDEIDLDGDGHFLKPTDSIIKTLDNIVMKKGTVNDSSGYPAWFGNPIAEMVYEGARYFSGKTTPTTTFDYSGATTDSNLGLSKATWVSPYSSANWCARPSQMVFSDTIPNKDSDSLPGSYFNSAFTGDLTGLNVSSIVNEIWADEYPTRSYTYPLNLIVGEVGMTAPGNNKLPTGKNVSNFSQIRGLVPEDPNKEGGYYAAAVAKWAKNNDVNATVDGNQKVDTFAIAMSSPLPRIQIKIAGNNVVVVPYGIGSTSGNQAGLYRMFVQQIANTTADNQNPNINNGLPYYRVRVNFGDAEFTGDFDMDALPLYEVSQTRSGKVKVYVSVDPVGKDKDESGNWVARATPDYGYAVTGNDMHIGYTIAGVGADDKPYLVVRNSKYRFTWQPCLPSTALSDYIHPLDDLSAKATYNDGAVYCPSSSKFEGPVAYTNSLRTYNTKYFTPSSTVSAAYVAHDPLWYAAKWGGFLDGYNASLGRVDATAKNNRLDNGEWEKVNSDGSFDASTPRNYFPVTNAATLPATLSKAFEEVGQRDSSASAVAQNSSRLSTETLIYQARFNPYFWSGELFAFKLDSSGVASTVPEWDAGKLIPEESSRKIFTWRESEKKSVVFDYNGTDTTTKLNSTEMAFLGVGLSEQKSVLRWLRGSRDGCRGTDCTSKSENRGTLRKRTSSTILGDIVNAAPLFAWTENFGYDEWSDAVGASTLGILYTSYRETKSNRKKMLYVGANDGMLHAFDAESGIEQFSYVPGLILNDPKKNLSALASPGYQHKYYVDGPLYVGDVALSNIWQTVLVGSLGSGGKGIFALNVSDPAGFSASSVLWEFTHPELGNVLSKPLISRLNDGNWYVLVANGVGSSTCDSTGYNKNACRGATLDRQNSKLFAIKINPANLSRNGWVENQDYYVISATNDVSGTAPINGLSAVTGLDSGGDRRVDYVYSGDMQGNLWKFDLTDSDPSRWGVAYKSGNTPAPLFVAQDGKSGSLLRQPITAPVEFMQHPTQSGYCVIFGTGRYLYASDVGNADIQSLYGVTDDGTKISGGRSDLQVQTINEEKEVSFDGYDYNIRLTSANSVASNKRGWFMDLLKPPSATQQGERSVVTPVLSAGKAMFTTLIPSTDLCVAGGSSWLMEIDPCSGGRLPYSAFDMDQNGSFTSSDYVDGKPISGLQPRDTRRTGDTSDSKKTLCQNPAIIKAGGTEYKVFSCTDGSVKTVANKGTQPFPRSSWRQLR